MRRLSYHFGTGHAPVHRHASAADADVPGGRLDGPDAVRLDFDGDGRVDDLLWDAAVGVVPAVRLSWADVRGRAAAGWAAHDSDGDGRADGVAVEADHDPRSAELVCDLDGDGRADQLLVDHDRDGAFESAYLSSAGSAVAGRWDVLLADTDGDGAVETSVDEGAPGWVPP